MAACSYHADHRSRCSEHNITREGSSMAAREQDYISTVRDLNRQLWNAVNGLKALQREHQALDYGTALEDGVGANEGITKVEVGAVVFATTDAIIALLDTGHATNLA